MEFSPFPLKFHTYPTHSLSHSAQFFLHQSRIPSLNPHLRVLKIKTCCSNNTIQLETQQSNPIKVATESSKKKRKPRPSFLEQIHDKWSLRINSPKERLPWQEPDPIQLLSKDEEKEEESSSRVIVSNIKTDLKPKPTVSDSVSFPIPLAYAPWEHGANLREPQFSSEPTDNYRNNNDERNGRGTTKMDKGFLRNGEGKIRTGLNSVVSLNEDEEELEDFEEVKRERGSGSGEGAPEMVKSRSNTKFAEKNIPEHELKRLRNIALRMFERKKVGSAGITQVVVDAIHEKWKIDEVVKLKFEKPLSLNMRRTHEILERKTGGLVIWRSGSSLVLYRGMTYKLPCVQSFAKQTQVDQTSLEHPSVVTVADALGNVGMKDYVKSTGSYVPHSARYMKDLSQEELIDMCELNHLLDELGPRFLDWSGREPFPVDADLLPPLVPGYKPPFRLLPYEMRPVLGNKDMTNIRRLARSTSPHFALGRNRELQGLAKAMVKLWEKSSIAKIAIKRGVQNTSNERMAEELKRLTGGVLLSRNKEYIVFYRGNDFMPPVVTEALTERQRLTELQYTEEDQARQKAAALIEANSKPSKRPQLAGTLAETIAATTRWGKLRSSEDVEEMIRESSIIKRASLVRYLEKKLAFAKGKLRKAERALAKVQKYLEPSDLPYDSEIISDEERFLFRKMGLTMKPYLLLGRRGVYDGTIENIHLHWKHRELVKIIVKGRNFAQVKHAAISLEAESGGLLVSVDKTTKGYAVILYRGKNYQFPYQLRPRNLLTRRQALARSIELQRREALKHHTADLVERIELLKSELDDANSGKKIDTEKSLYENLNDTSFDAEETEEEDEGEEAYLETYDSSNEDAAEQNESVEDKDQLT